MLDGYVLDFAAATRCDLLVVGSEFDQVGLSSTMGRCGQVGF